MGILDIRQSSESDNRGRILLSNWLPAAITISIQGSHQPQPEPQLQPRSWRLLDEDAVFGSRSLTLFFLSFPHFLIAQTPPQAFLLFLLQALLSLLASQISNQDVNDNNRTHRPLQSQRQHRPYQSQHHA